MARSGVPQPRENSQRVGNETTARNAKNVRPSAGPLNLVLALYVSELAKPVRSSGTRPSADHIDLPPQARTHEIPKVRQRLSWSWEVLEKRDRDQLFDFGATCPVGVFESV
jgi:hypothetical protein